MPDRHKNPPISIRLPDDDRTWLLQYAAATGQHVNAIIRDLVAKLRKEKS